MMEKNILTGDIQERMFREMADKTLFNLARDYAFEYADNELIRNVFPTPEAIEGLKKFDEEMPLGTNDPEDVLRQLHKYGSPATVMQSGGRYYGFVIGGIVPVSLAAKWLGDFWIRMPVFIQLRL